ncbi:hypothetical protein OAS39_06470 [Pirellulales bacterium]|nr:hypothetical protein [Pirellulales bacterium]
MKCVLLEILLVSLAASGCAESDGRTQNLGADSQSRQESAKHDINRDADNPAPIGSARLQEDGTLVLQLRAEGPGGIVGDAQRIYKPTDPKYQRTLDHIGGLEPGESKPLPPWPQAADQP